MSEARFEATLTAYYACRGMAPAVVLRAYARSRAAYAAYWAAQGEIDLAASYRTCAVRAMRDARAGRFGRWARVVAS